MVVVKMEGGKGVESGRWKVTRGGKWKMEGGKGVEGGRWKVAQGDVKRV